jgi:hypothetical protein
VSEEAPPVEVEVEKPHLPHPTGHRRLDLVLPIVAVFVSFVSILIAWHHTHVMQDLVHQNEKLVEANSLPYLQLSGSSANQHLTFSAINEGVGPAKIETAEVFVGGRPVQSLDQLIAACCAKDNYSGISTSSLEGRMVRPGESVTFIDLPLSDANREAALLLDKARQSKRIVTRLCYCSVFEDCWVARSDDPTPDPIKNCAPVARAYRE